MSTSNSRWAISRWLSMTLMLALVALPACEGGGGNDWDYGTNDPNYYVALGDSITENGYPSVLAGLLGARVDDDGHGGYISEEGIGVARSALSRSPGTALILYGANDCIHGLDESDTVANLRTIVEMAKGQMTRPVIANVMPMIDGHEIFNPAVDRLNPLLEAMASEEGITVVDLHTIFDLHHEYFNADGLHPNSAGTAAIAQAFYDALQ